jgi:hypothetical protein
MMRKLIKGIDYIHMSDYLEAINIHDTITDAFIFTLILWTNFKNIFLDHYLTYAFNMFPSRDLPAIVNDNNTVPTETTRKRKSLTSLYFLMNNRRYVSRSISDTSN